MPHECERHAKGRLSWQTPPEGGRCVSCARSCRQADCPEEQQVPHVSSNSGCAYSDIGHLHCIWILLFEHSRGEEARFGLEERLDLYVPAFKWHGRGQEES
jgi:hypothetical protein